MLQYSPNATDQLLLYFSDWRKLKVPVAWFLNHVHDPSAVKAKEKGIACS